MDELKRIDSIRTCTKERLLEKIKSARFDISLIGPIAFDLPWSDLADSLKANFRREDFTIHILRESETTIAQYALLTASQEEDGDYGNLSRGNLIGIKDKVIRELKDLLEESNQGNNIEPPEDKYAKELGKIYYEEKRKYILKSYSIHGCESSFKEYIGRCVEDTVMGTENYFLGHPEFVKLITENISSDPEFVSRFANHLKRILRDLIAGITCCLGNLENLQVLEETNKYGGLEAVIGKKGQTSVYANIKVDIGKTDISKRIELPIEKWIDAFTPEAREGDVKYRIEADKIQAIKRASDVKRQKLEEYQRDPKKRQRLFIKNCYMPIPIPMIKIDHELFITMALTRFDNIAKFQYVGDVAVDEETGTHVAESGKDEYRSLWLDEFVRYYTEYFVNENGAQKYSTEETKEGNRKEVIDIFDENRSRIGIGPRDAFLSNMAIVKSVVWALIFDRQGRILIHQRAKNAKDNQGLWDKSVGGHVSTEDLDTIEAIKREIAEELFTIEHEGQGGHDSVQWMITNKNKIIYLGDWKTSRFPDLGALNLSPDEYYNFSLNYPDINRRDFRRDIVITERLLPNGESVKAKCFVDPYLCVVSEDFEIKSLQNSKYALLTPNELKRCVLRKKIKLNGKREYDAENGVEEEFNPTSDLAYLVESAIWDDIVTEFAKRIRETFSRAQENGNGK